MYAQRTIPALLDFCRDMREVASEDVLFLNYANPMAMNTWACNQYGKVNTIGLCHGVQGAHWQITSCIEHWAKAHGLFNGADGKTVGKDGCFGQEIKLHRKEVDVVFSGINHQTWCVNATYRGADFIHGVAKQFQIEGETVTVPSLLELFEAHPRFPTTEKARIDVLRRFGYYSTESNGRAEISNRVKSARLLDGGKPITFEQRGDRLLLRDLPMPLIGPIATTIALEIEGELKPLQKQETFWIPE